MNTDWETRYQAGDTPWDKGSASPPLVDWLKKNSMQGRVLVPGCGSGQDVRAIAATGTHVLGLDIAPSAIRAARGNHNITTATYEEGDLFELSPEFAEAFDWVFEHTCFCAISPVMRRDYVNAVGSVLRSGGHLLAVFYLNPGLDDPDDGPPFSVSREELYAYFDEDFVWINDYVPTVAFPGREGREVLALLRKR